ncbi:MAG: DUF58 domain-containing protein [Defluviitaleaceae bacterium]|nr:DUF58 domain-containing protein [Defluviitaleaceae bacterium]
MLYIIQEFFYRKLWSRKLTVEVSYGSRDAFEGQTVGFQETVWNGKRIPMPYINIRYTQSQHLRQTDLSGKSTYSGRDRSSLFAVPGKRRVTRKTLLVCEKRGFYVLSKGTVLSSDMLLSRTYRKDIELSESLTVYPREIEVSDIEIPYKRLCGEVLTKRFILPDPFEFGGVREYQPFDSFRQINFNAWAKTGVPMSNIYGHTVSQEVRIVLNMQRYSLFYRDGVFENAIRLAAFLARQYLEAGIPVSFVTNGLDCVTYAPGRAEKGRTMRHLREIYEILARMDISKNVICEPITAFLPEKSELNADGMVVALISSYDGGELYEWHNATVEAGVDVLWIAPRCEHDKNMYKGAVVAWEVPND